MESRTSELSRKLLQYIVVLFVTIPNMLCNRNVETSNTLKIKAFKTTTSNPRNLMWDMLTSVWDRLSIVLEFA